MSVLIKGMEMPTRCGRCDMRIPVYDDGIFDHYECCITAAIIDNIGEKMEDCPLVPVPPHGDLISRETAKLYHSYLVDERTDIRVPAIPLSVLNVVPTVIPADPAEEGEK